MSKVKAKVGVIVFAKVDKTVRVRVSRMFCHPVYKKVVKKYKSYVVHDENGLYKGKEGMVVSIRESPPLSATKRWIVVND